MTKFYLKTEDGDVSIAFPSLATAVADTSLMLCIDGVYSDGKCVTEDAAWEWADGKDLTFEIIPDLFQDYITEEVIEEYRIGQFNPERDV